MEKLFKQIEGISFIEFTKQFPDDRSCRQYLSELKWSEGFKCRHCGHNEFYIKPDGSHQCKKCLYTESPTANTLFHKVKFGLRKAFLIVYDIVTTKKGVSTLQLSKRYSISYKTAWFLVQKVRRVMLSSGNNKLNGKIEVDEFMIGSKEPGKQGRSRTSKKDKVILGVEKTEDGKIKRVYFEKIKDFTLKEISNFFEKYISKQAEILTDRWSINHCQNNGI